MILRHLLLPALCLGFLVGCDDDDDSATTQDAAPQADSATNDSAVTPNDSAVTPVDSAVAPVDSAVAPVDSAVVEPDAAPLETCAAGGTTDCVINDDCPADQRCQNRGTADMPLPCCTVGARGTAPAGESCAGQNGELFCASSICIEGDTGEFCSQPCEGNADCPAVIPNCTAIPFFGSFCFPTD